MNQSISVDTVQLLCRLQNLGGVRDFEILRLLTLVSSTSGFRLPIESVDWILGLGGRATKDMLGQLVAEGITDVRNVPVERLNDTQRRIQRVTQGGQTELLPGAGEFESSLGYPRYYVDFETVASPVPLGN